MSEKITRTATITVDLSRFTRAVVATCAMVEAAIEQYDDTATSFTKGYLRRNVLDEEVGDDQD